MTKSIRMLLIAAAMLTSGAAGYLFALKERPSSKVQAFAGSTSIEWAVLEPKLIAAVERADRAARDRLLLELETWKDGVMKRVDPGFLDWYFDYFRTRWADLKWLGRWVWELGDRKDPDKQHLEEIITAFAEKEMPPQKIQEDIERIVRLATEDFTNTLSATIMNYRTEAGAHLSVLDSQLEAIVFRDDGRAAEISLKDLAQRPRASSFSIDWIEPWFKRHLAAPAPELGQMSDTQKVVSVIAAAVRAGNFATATAMALGATKATAATIGTTACAVVIIAAIGVHDWWSHEHYVEANRGKLRGHIDASLKEFMTAALQADGRLGLGLDALKSQMISAIRKRSPAERA